jgi:hypothetical protein
MTNAATLASLAVSGALSADSSGNVGIGTTVNNVFDQVAAARPLVVQKSDTSTTVNGSTASITITNADTTTSNTAQLNFAAITGASTNQYSSAVISCIFGARTNAQYPTGILTFSTSTSLNSAPTEKARIDSSGNLLVGTTTSQGRLTVQTATTTAGTRMAAFADANGRFSGFYEGADGTTFNAANTVLGVRSTTGTGRSINASGTVNASGADYAEYMTKAGDFVVAKGDVVGINQQGLITNVFAESVSFVVKSTSPSYVGGDTWGGGFEDDLEALEAARQKVDRIAFAGQVPVNVLSATPGQYIVPVEDNGGIRGVAKNEADLTLAEYMRAVGKVIAIETDGRAKIIVKVA